MGIGLITTYLQVATDASTTATTQQKNFIWLTVIPTRGQYNDWITEYHWRAGLIENRGTITVTHTHKMPVKHGDSLIGMISNTSQGQCIIRASFIRARSGWTHHVLMAGGG